MTTRSQKKIHIRNDDFRRKIRGWGKEMDSGENVFTMFAQCNTSMESTDSTCYGDIQTMCI